MTNDNSQLSIDFAASKAKRIVNYGAGVDSTAMLVGMYNRGWDAPDMIIFSDTGSEKAETIEYLDTMDAWLASVNWPKITRVAYKPSQATYTTLAGLCIVNQTLPSLAFGKHSCSLRFKVEVIDRFLNGVSRGSNKCEAWLPAAQRIGKSYKVREGKVNKTKFEETELKATKFIGYDNGTADIRRANKSRKEDHQFKYEYPLQSWGWAREECIAQIIKAGLPVPIKSACFMCPASKKWELYWLAAKHPEQFLQAIEIEETARNGKHGLQSTKGLGRTWAWKAWAEEAGILRDGAIVMSQAQLLELAAAEKPAYESNDVSLPCAESFGPIEEAA